MKALRLLTFQHDEVETLISQIQDESTYEEKKKLFLTLAQKLFIHMEIEEEIFYPAVYKVDSDEVKHAIAEHEEVKPIIKELLQHDLGEAAFNAKLIEIKNKISHHVEEEENELFPKCRKNMDKEILDDLGEEMIEYIEANFTDSMRHRQDKAS